MKAVAQRICELKPKTKEAVVMIRRLRVGQKPVDVLQLANEIIALVNNFIRRYPGATKEQILDALHTAITLKIVRTNL